MKLLKWDELPQDIKKEEVKKYYDILNNKRLSLFIKRAFDILCSSIMLIVLSPLFLVVAIAIKIDSHGPIFYRQERVTQYGKIFRIHKFRSMVNGADKKGTLVTISNDSRITKVGSFIRKYKIDELPQLIDVFLGDMTFVGVRPEVQKYVDAYSNEMKATLLLPAGITNLASICYINENDLIKEANDVDDTYINVILPGKMVFNLKGILNFSLIYDLKLIFMTFLSIFGWEYKEK